MKTKVNNIYSFQNSKQLKTDIATFYQGCGAVGGVSHRGKLINHLEKRYLEVSIKAKHTYFMTPVFNF